MITKFKNITKLVKTSNKFRLHTKGLAVFTALNKDVTTSNFVDIDFEAMMDDEKSYYGAEDTLSSSDGIILKSLDMYGAPIAPIDIDGWACDEEAKFGTVDIDLEKKIEYPPIPKVRTNTFIFQGIKIVLPDKLLQSQTYRYRLDEEDQCLADDIRICKFEKAVRVDRE